MRVNFQYGGETRMYWLYKPQSARPGGPVIVDVPGQGFPTDGVPLLESLADQNGIVLAFPVPKKNWLDPAEKPYIGAVIDDVVARNGADASRVYLTGGSAGGIEAYEVACTPAGAKVAGVGGLFAGITTSTGGPAALASECKPPHPMVIVELHGTADTATPYNGRPCEVSKDTGRTVCLPSQLELMQFWAKVDGCSPTPTTTTTGKLRVDIWQSCSAGTAVELNSVEGGDHGLSGVTAGGVSPFQRLWNFLSAYPGAVAKPLKLQASLVSGRVVGRGATRKLVVVVSTNAAASGRVILKRGTATAASGVFKASGAGKATVRLALRAGTRTGTYTLTISLRGPQGQTVLKRAVKVPS